MLNLTNLFTALGRAGKNGYLINTAQSAQGTPFSELAGYSYLNPAWLATLAQSYDQMIRVEPTGMGVWQTAAQAIVLGLVSAQSPVDGQQLGTALAYVRQAMLDQSKTVQECTITGAGEVTPGGANVGDGVLVVTVTRADGLIQQNVVQELTQFTVTADSYTGGATAGQERWQWAGQPNVSTYGTGTGVGVWDFDWPAGSGAVVTGQAVSADQDAATNGNLTTNGNAESWAGTGPAVLDNWALPVGTWGTTIAQSSTSHGGTYSVQFVAGATLNALTQQFGSSVSDGTDPTAGTPVSPAPLASYGVNLWLRTVSGTASAGVLTVELVDGSGTVIQDAAGNNNSYTVNLTTLTTTWAAFPGTFRTPAVLPAVVRLRVRVSTGLTGADVLLDDVCFARYAPLYLGGPSAVLYSGSTPFETGDEWAPVFTNDRGGASFGATWQTLVLRLFQTPGLLLPYSGSPNIADSLITGA